MKITTTIKSFLALALVLATAGVALASSGGGAGAFHPKGFALQVLNFAILVTILVYFGRKPIVQFFRDRIEGIAKGISEASKAKEAAESALAEVQKKLDSKDQEIEKMVQAAREAGENEREHLIKEGERMSARVVEQAKAGIEFELDPDKASLKAVAADHALKLAKDNIGQKLGADEQKALMADAIKRLEGRA